MERTAERIPDPRGVWDAVTVLDDEAETVSKLGAGRSQLFHTQRRFAEHPDKARANRRR